MFDAALIRPGRRRHQRDWNGRWWLSAVLLASLVVCPGLRADDAAPGGDPRRRAGCRAGCAGSDAVQHFIDDQQIAGAVVVVSHRGVVVLDEAIGQADIDRAIPMQDDTIFRIYSMTKPLTSVIVMMLVEEGKVELDAPVAQYLPELEHVQVATGADGSGRVAPARDMTVRDLLRHTSGLTYGLFGDTPVDRLYREAGILTGGNDDLQTTVSKISQMPLLYQPGTRFNYSVSTDVLGRLIERVTGQSLDVAFQERLLTPLKMTDTGFQVPADKLHRLAANYGPDDQGGLRVIDDPLTSKFAAPAAMLSGGGGLVSTGHDYLRFCQMLLNDGALDGVRILKPETVHELTTNQLPDGVWPISVGDSQRPGTGFGLGFSVIVEPIPFFDYVPVGEYGWGGAASTHFWISPRDDLAVVVLSQYKPFSFRLEGALKPIIYRSIRQ